MSDATPNREQLKWRSRRGMQELDVLLGDYMGEHYDQAPPEAQRAYTRLLEQEDDQLWEWLSGKSDPDDDDLKEIVNSIRRK